MDEVQQVLKGNWEQGPPEIVKGIRRLVGDFGLAAQVVARGSG